MPRRPLAALAGASDCTSEMTAVHTARALLVLSCLVGAACEADDSSPVETVRAVADSIPPGGSEQYRGGGNWQGPLPDAAEVEVGYTTLVTCLTEAGLSGTIRFDLTISTAMILDISLGATPEQARAGQQLVDRCSEPFDTLVSAYMAGTYSDTEVRVRVGGRVMVCAEQHFPGLIAHDAGYDDLLLEYEALLASSPLMEPRECLDEAKAGPKHSFGQP